MAEVKLRVNSKSLASIGASFSPALIESSKTLSQRIESGFGAPEHPRSSFSCWHFIHLLV